MRLASGENVAERTGPPTETRFKTRPEATSEIVNVLSCDDAATSRPSGLNETLVTGPSCVTVWSAIPVRAFQRTTRPSAVPVAAIEPSGLNAAVETADPAGLNA